MTFLIYDIITMSIVKCRLTVFLMCFLDCVYPTFHCMWLVNKETNVNDV
jgi:hypothetical protein